MKRLFIILFSLVFMLGFVLFPAAQAVATDTAANAQEIVRRAGIDPG